MRFILGAIHFALIVWAVLSIMGSNASGTVKLLWGLGVVIFPIVGFVAWLIAGPKKGGAAS